MELENITEFFRKNRQSKIIKPNFTFNFSTFTLILSDKFQTLPPAAGVAVAAEAGTDDRMRASPRTAPEIRLRGGLPRRPSRPKRCRLPPQLKKPGLARLLAPDMILLTADTVVVLDGEVPASPADATRPSKCSGGCRDAATRWFRASRCARRSGCTASGRGRTSGSARSHGRGDRNTSIDTCRPFDKAGSYGIQEWIGYAAIERIEGSFYNVMGLPIQKVYVELDKFLDR